MTFREKLFMTVAAFTAVILVVALILAAAHILVMFFAGILISLVILGVARFVRHLTPLKGSVAVVAGLFAVVALMGIITMLLGPSLVDEFDKLSERLPESIREVEDWLHTTAWGSELLNALPPADDLDSAQIIGSSIFTQLTGLVSSALGFLLDAFIIVFIGVYLAIEPDLYSHNFVRLFPQASRQRIAAVLREVAEVLIFWLLARAASVVVVIILTAIGLWFLDMPLALTLAFIAGVLAFVPNLGTFLGSLPAILIAFSVSPTMALNVILLFIIVQLIENYLITPNIERYTLSLPPALTIALQVLAAILLGPLAVLVAAPALAMFIVLIKDLYIEDVLNDSTHSLVHSFSK